MLLRTILGKRNNNSHSLHDHVKKLIMKINNAKPGNRMSPLELFSALFAYYSNANKQYYYSK